MEYFPHAIQGAGEQFRGRNCRIRQALSQIRRIQAEAIIVYRPRRPQDTDYYHCVEDYFEIFVRNYGEHFSRQYGSWRPNLQQVIYQYLGGCFLNNLLV
jgi:hypothetical protein